MIFFQLYPVEREGNWPAIVTMVAYKSDFPGGLSGTPLSLIALLVSSAIHHRDSDKVAVPAVSAIRFMNHSRARQPRLIGRRNFHTRYYILIILSVLTPSTSISRSIEKS